MMNTLDDCDLLEKVVNMTNVSIKVQQFRFRCLIVLMLCVIALAISVIMNQVRYQ